MAVIPAVRLSGALLLSLALAVSAAAQSRTIDYEAIRQTKQVTAIRIDEPVTLDGRLDEPFWERAIPASEFYQKLPDNGAPASERTEVRFAYDDDNLYIGVTCYDSEPGRLMIKDLREDFEFGQTDLVQVFIDSLHDFRSGFTFVVNPGGARRDTQVSNNGTTNQDWDGVWDAKVSRTADRWFVEYQIPFKTLRFSQDRTQEWGLNVTRRIVHRNEESNWSPVPVRYNGTRGALAGTLTGLENVRQGRNLKVKPFVIGSGTQLRGRPRATDFDGGFDAKYSITPSLTFDATYRTDFAQVEADQQQINLTRFNLFFPEKRDFFLENSGIFTFGAGSQGNANSSNQNLVPFFSRRIGLSPAGTAVPIVGGTRVSGHVSGYDVGVLAMRTEDAGPLAANTYLVGRVKRNLLSTSWVGAIVTDRESATAGDYNRVYGPDVHLQFFDRLEIDSYLLRSDTPGRPGQNQARKLATVWRDDEVSASAEYSAVQDNFDPQVGFVRRGDMSQYSGEVSWKPLLRNDPRIRNLNFTGVVDYYNDAQGRLETRSQEVTTGVQFENSGLANLTVNQTFDRLVRPFEIRPGVFIPAGDYEHRRYTTTLDSGAGRRLGAGGSVSWGEFWHGDNTTLTAAFDVRPNHHLNLDLNYSRSRVDLPSGAFTTNLVGARVLYGFSPRAFLNALIQYNADARQVSSNVRFNFTHHPLSDLYVVYNDRRDTLTGQVVERALILKLTNLFTF